MGQKVHPKGFRLGFTQRHLSCWYASPKEYSDYVVKAIWFNTASRDTNKTGTATTDLFLYNMRFYHDMHASANSGSNGNGWLRTAWRTLGNRDKPFVTE